MVNRQLRFEVLGPVRAWQGDTELPLGSPQQRAVLGILLLLEGAVATPDQLVSALWGENPPSAAVGMVRSYVSRLRRTLGDGGTEQVITSVAGGYALSAEPGVSDVADYQRRIDRARRARHAGDIETEAAELRAALALWTGTPLFGVRGEYAEQERTRLAYSRLAAMEDLAAADLELGRHVEAADALAGVVAEQPLRERPRELLMLALYRSGRQAEALGLYQETQALLGEELGLDPGPELREMQRRILASDPSLAGPVHEQRPVDPEQFEWQTRLPPDLPCFAGRTEQVRLVREALRPSQTGLPVVGLTGLAGIGKTVLAVHVGHRAAADFPDGQFFVDLACAADPLTELLSRVGVAGSAVPDGAAERARLWQSLTAGRRVLLVVDGAGEADQVRQLMPGPGGAAVLVTSRQRLFGLPYANWLKVDVLPEHESLALLEEMVGAERVRAESSEARNLVRITDGVPLVVHAVGDRLLSRPAWSLATAVRRLGGRGGRQQHGECGGITDVYQAAMDGLPPAQARALRLLAVPDGPDISLTAAAAVLGLPVEEAEAVLESLADRHFLEPEADDRYRYLSPVRAFARFGALLHEGRTGCDTAVARAAEFYAASAFRALAAVDPDSLHDLGVTEPGGRGRDSTEAEWRPQDFASAEAARAWLLAHHEHLRVIAVQASPLKDAPSDLLDMIIDMTDGTYRTRRAARSAEEPRSSRLARSARN